MIKLESPSIAVVGTFDTKTDELQYLTEQIQFAGEFPLQLM